MKSKIMLFLESAIALSIVLLLSGCFGDGGSSNAYDGTWTVVFVDSAFVAPAPAASGGTATCLLPTPLAKITLVNGIGSTIQYNPCYNTEVTPLNIVVHLTIAWVKANLSSLTWLGDERWKAKNCTGTCWYKRTVDGREC